MLTPGGQTQEAPVTVVPWPGTARTEGAYIISPIELTLLNLLCSQMEANLRTAIEAITVLNRARVINGTTNFIRRVSFVSITIENTYFEIAKYIDSLLLCDNQTISQIWELYGEFDIAVTKVWDVVETWEELESSQHANPAVTQAFLANRPQPQNVPSFRPPGAVPDLFIGALVGGLGVGLATGLASGTILDAIFEKDNTEEIKTLNRNVQRVNKRIQFTNQRLSVLSANFTNAVRNVKIILEQLRMTDEEAEARRMVLWNLEHISRSATNSLILFQMCEQSIVLLREGIINPDLIEIETFRKIIIEGEEQFPTLEFPIQSISNYNLPSIVKLLEVQDLGRNKFVVIVPLTNKPLYNIYSLIPHPVKLESSDTLMIPEINEILVTDENNYISTNKDNLYAINNSSYLVRQINPIWNINRTSCEYECFKGNTSAILILCNFKRLGITRGLFLTETSENRLLYLMEETTVELNCPDGRVRDSLIGLHTVPYECDIVTKLVTWPARQTRHIQVENLVTTLPKAYDITSLPTYTVNNSDPIHDSLKRLIKELPTDTNSFKIDFENYDFSLEEVQSYTVIASGALSVIVTINSILVGLIYLGKCKRWVQQIKKGNRSETKIEMNDIERGIRSRIKSRLSHASEITPRGSLREAKKKVSETRDKVRKKVTRRIPSSHRKAIRSARASLREKVRASPRVALRKLKPYLASTHISPRNTLKNVAIELDNIANKSTQVGTVDLIPETLSTDSRSSQLSDSSESSELESPESYRRPPIAMYR